jgi:predicted RNA-binding Zn-ribbon protein involved in translation (DUF1610 family)
VSSPPRIIEFDESGVFVLHAFYQLVVPFPGDSRESSEAEGILSSLGPSRSFGEVVYASIEPTWTYDSNCDLFPCHTVARSLKSCEAELFGGHILETFVHDQQFVLIDATFRQQLIDSELRGFLVTDVPIRLNQSEVLGAKVCRVSSNGQSCLRQRKVNLPTSNTCIYCGWGPVVCPDCRFVNHSCPACGQVVVVRESDSLDPTDRRFRIQRRPRSGDIVDAHLWDGSDFVPSDSSLVVTRRVVDWLLSVHAISFAAMPLRANVQQTCEEVRMAIEVMQGSQSPQTMRQPTKD